MLYLRPTSSARAQQALEAAQRAHDLAEAVVRRLSAPPVPLTKET